MLVLVRKIGQSFYINNNIKIELIDARLDGAKIGITAPDDVRILREEKTEDDYPIQKEE